MLGRHMTVLSSFCTNRPLNASTNKKYGVNWTERWVQFPLKYLVEMAAYNTHWNYPPNDNIIRHLSETLLSFLADPFMFVLMKCINGAAHCKVVSVMGMLPSISLDLSSFHLKIQSVWACTFSCHSIIAIQTEFWIILTWTHSWASCIVVFSNFGLLSR